MDEELQLLKTANSNFDWLEQHYDELIEKHNNHYIAIHDGTLIVVDENLDSLLNTLHNRKIELSSTLIKYVTNVITILQPVSRV